MITKEEQKRVEAIREEWLGYKKVGLANRGNEVLFLLSLIDKLQKESRELRNDTIEECRGVIQVKADEALKSTNENANSYDYYIYCT